MYTNIVYLLSRYQTIFPTFDKLVIYTTLLAYIHQRMIGCVFYNIFVIPTHILSNLFRRHYLTTLKLLLELLLLFRTHSAHNSTHHILD